MTSRIEPLPRGAAGPISLLHRACFPEDPWEARGDRADNGDSRVFWPSWVGEDPRRSGSRWLLHLARKPKSCRSGSCRTIGGAELVWPFSTRYAPRPDCGAPNASCSKWRRTTKRRARYMPREVLLSSDVVGITTAEQNGWSMRSYCECSCQPPRFHFEFGFIPSCLSVSCASPRIVLESARL